MSDRPEPASTGDIEISVVCAPERWAGDLAAVHREFREQLLRTGRRAEFIYVLNGPSKSAEESLSRVEEDHFEVRVLRLAKGFDEAAALAGRIRGVIEALSIESADVLGPNPCTLSRLRGRYRHDLLVRTPTASALRKLTSVLEADNILRTKAETTIVDVDPVSLT